MTTRKLLEELRNQLNAITAAISLIEQIENSESRASKAANILNHLKGRTKHTVRITKKQYSPKGKKYNGTHWMQQPENKDRVRAMVKKMHRAMGHRIK